MAVDFLLKIDGAGIKGESPVEGYKDYIQILKFEWAGKNTGTFSYGEGGGGGKFEAKDFTFTQKVNQASPKLMEANATGAHVKTAILVCRKAGGKSPVEFLKVTMTDLLVSSYKIVGMDSLLREGPTPTDEKSRLDDVPLEEITLNFAKIIVEYKTQKADGSPGPIQEGGYDLKKIRAGR
jgi:type VI secretion system secreted protein Hcp